MKIYIVWCFSTSRYDWLQTDDSITVIMYTKCPEFREEDLIIDAPEDNELKITACINDYTYCIHLGELNSWLCDNVRSNVYKEHHQLIDFSRMLLTLRCTESPWKSTTVVYHVCVVLCVIGSCQWISIFLFSLKNL